MQFTTISDPLNVTIVESGLSETEVATICPASPQGVLRTSMLHTVLPGSVPPPSVTRADSKIMRHLATLMHSSASRGHGMAAALLPGSLFLKTPRVIVHATASQAPLYLGEAETVAVATGLPVLLLRRSANGSSLDLTVDVALPGATDLTWLLGYRLFRTVAGDSWLVPPVRGLSIQLMRHGLFASEHAPYFDHWDCDEGLERASAHLASHRMGGWPW